MEMGTGLRGFSPAIDRLLDHRIYAPHTADAVLQDSALVVCPESYARLSAPPDIARLRLDELPGRRPLLAALIERLGLTGSWHERLGRLARFTADIERIFPSPEHSAARGFYPTLDDFWWGGTEEQVIAKGSDWCHEVARVYCALAQVAGVPARIVYTLGREDGHAIAECFVEGAWVLVDPLAPHVYRREDGGPLGVVEMACADAEQRRSLTGEGRHGTYVRARFFEFTAVAEYYLIEADRYDYGPSHCNAFYRGLLGPIWNGGPGD
jgi:transglutaminase-like putative cysteine protease